jgi:DNA-binding CsgD family transcriptional regulator
MDSRLKPLYANAEAVKILAYPRGGGTAGSLQKLVLEKVQPALPQLGTRIRSSFLAAFQSGRRRYICRLFSLRRSSGKNSHHVVALLLERNRTSLHVLQMARAFHLTQREQEAVEYLVRGLTSKEIGERMRISPNTVKAFLRLVMIKTGTSTRSGIIGKFIQESSLDSK